MSCRSRARVDLASLPGAMVWSHSSVYFASVICPIHFPWGSDLHSLLEKDGLFVQPFFT